MNVTAINNKYSSAKGLARSAKVLKRSIKQETSSHKKLICIGIGNLAFGAALSATISPIVAGMYFLAGGGIVADQISDYRKFMNSDAAKKYKSIVKSDDYAAIKKRAKKIYG